ncbi:MAG: lipoyl(octanoyl) transferase LipB [Pseudomonadales bacterium]
MPADQLVVRNLGRAEYESVWQAMKQFTLDRGAETGDEIWLVEHPPVFTLGQAGKAIHILQDVGIPVVNSDRGGQVTYHGPGQLVGYLLFDIRRKKLNVRDLVSGIEQAIIRVLATYDIAAEADPKAPGVYINQQKIAALGLRVRKGCSYHGFSLNVDMDLAPFTAINPCGYQGLEVTSLKKLGKNTSMPELARKLVDEISSGFQYDGARWIDKESS